MTDIALRLSNMAGTKFVLELSSSLDGMSSGGFSIPVIEATVHDVVAVFEELGPGHPWWTSSSVGAL